MVAQPLQLFLTLVTIQDGAAPESQHRMVEAADGGLDGACEISGQLLDDRDVCFCLAIFLFM